MSGLFIFFYFSARKWNCFFSTFYFSAEKGKSFYGRPLDWTFMHCFPLAWCKHYFHVHVWNRNNGTFCPSRYDTTLHIARCVLFLPITLLCQLTSDVQILQFWTSVSVPVWSPATTQAEHHCSTQYKHVFNHSLQNVSLADSAKNVSKPNTILPRL